MGEFLTFCFHNNIQDITAAGPIMAFVQTKIEKNLGHRTINNYVSSLKQYMKRVGFSIKAFEHEAMKRLLKAIAKIPTPIIPKGVLDVEQLDALFRINRSLDAHTPYAAAFTLGVFAFLRISNVVPANSQSFDPAKQLTRGDIIWTQSGIRIRIKWAKNLQKSDQYHEAAVPRLENRLHMCPTSILISLLASSSGLPHAPLIPVRGRPLTERQVRDRLAYIVELLGFANRGITFHALRRSGVTMAFHSGASIESIRAHGAWASDAVWQYVKHTERVTQRIPQALATLFK